MNMIQDLPNIYGYNDFRKFLADYQQSREKWDSGFSKSAICKRLGIPNTRSYLNDVINGRKVTPSYIERFIHVFEFKQEEAQFFRVLVKFNQAENNNEKELYLEQLISLNKTPKKIIDKKAFAFFREWHHSVIRTLLDNTGRWGDADGPFLIPSDTSRLALMGNQHLPQGTISIDNLKIWNFSKTDFSDRFKE